MPNYCHYTTGLSLWLRTDFGVHVSCHFSVHLGLQEWLCCYFHNVHNVGETVAVCDETVVAVDDIVVYVVVAVAAAAVAAAAAAAVAAVAAGDVVYADVVVLALVVLVG